MNNQTDISLKFTNKITNLQNLEKYEKRLESLKKTMQDFPQGVNLGSFSEIADSSEKVAKAFNNIKFGAIVIALKKISNITGKLISQSSSYLENVNLYQVAFNGLYQEADHFVNKMTEMYGLDESWGTRTVGIFRQLANAMGLAREEADRLSYLMTQMSVDISSLFNVDVDRASQILQSALAGQTRPIRSVTGADITMNTLQTTLDQLGIDRAINQLSFAEKRLIIIVSLTKQLTQATGDWGRTLESPANQTRILSEQWDRLTRAFGNVLLPIVSKILPIVNGILMAMVEIVNLLASLVGYSADDYDYFTDMADSVLDLEEGLDGATESAKKLKQGLRGFDKLNVITTPNSGGASTSIGGIGSDILNAYNLAYDEYMQKLDKVRMKATDIRDRILEWLGFTKEINPITGKTEWSYQGIKTTLKNIWEWFKKLSPLGKSVVGIMTTLFSTKLINLIKTFAKVLAGTKIASLLLPVKNLFEYMIGFGKASGSVTEGMRAGMSMWNSQLTLMERMKVLLVGAGGLIISFTLLDSAFKEITESGEASAGSIAKLSGGIAGLTASGALLGSQFGVYGAVIGGFIGLMSGLIDTYVNFPNEIDRTTTAIQNAINPINEYNNSLQNQYDEIRKTMEANLSLQGSYTALLTELEEITDENGKVKDGYEDRAKFIITTLNKAYGLEIEMIDGVITGYKEQVKQIKNIIAEKRKQIALESAEEAYTMAIKNKAESYKNYTSALEQQSIAQENVNKATEEYNSKIEIGGWALYRAQKRLAEANEALWEANAVVYDTSNAYQQNVDAIMTYEGLLSASTEENAELVDKYINDIENSYYDGKNYIKLTQEEQEQDAIKFFNSVLSKAKLNGQEINDSVIASAEERLNSIKKNLSDITSEVDGPLGTDIVNSWKLLASNSETKFMEEFGKLPTDIQQKVVDEMYSKGYSISKNLQDGINQQNPTIKFGADMSSAEIEVNNFTQRKTFSFWDAIKSLILPGISIATHADGGMPPVGQMFIANEKGPELIGQIGGKSFVANQNQMLGLIRDEISSKTSGMNNATFIIQVGDEEIARHTINKMEDMARANGKPFVIGG